MADKEQWATGIYLVYPRKVGRRVAIKAIEKALGRLEKRFEDDKCPDLKAVEYLTDKTEEYLKATERWPAGDRKFIPHPSTWYNQDRFDDDPEEWSRGDSAKPRVHNERGDRQAGSF